MDKNIPTLFHMFLETHEKYKNNTAFIYKLDKKQFEVTYEKLFEDVLLLSRAFSSKGVQKGSKVMFLCDNRYEWMVTDLALVSLGAISIPRGSDTPTQELEFIMKHSEATFLILESEALHTLHKEMVDKLKLKATFIIEAGNVHTLFDNLYSYIDLLKNREIYNNEIEEFHALKNELTNDDIFTLIYTSGTTGTPKGVILRHKNIMWNVDNIPTIIGLTQEDLWVSILPSWHIYERAAEYISIAKGSCIVYSTIKTFASDLEEYKPTLVATVPRLWESMYTKINNAIEKKDPKKAKIFKKLVNISAKYNYNLRIIKDELPRYEKEGFSSCLKKFSAYIKLFFLYLPNKFAKKKLKLVQQKFGGRLRHAISGGGTLPEFIDTWIDAIGISIVNSYGMTECSPSIAGRDPNRDSFYTIGPAIEKTELKIINNQGEVAKTGEAGEIILKGAQVTSGYFKNDEENKKSFTQDGYFKTGDLGKLTIKNELVITGRSKEIIVLANGENVDPSRIESAISMLPFITDNILVGQDKKGLGMLVVPDFEKLKEYVQENFDKAVHSMEQLKEDTGIMNKIKKDMNDLLHQKEGFKPFEKLQNIHFLKDEFKTGEELTNTFKKKRHIIEKKYKETIDKFLK